MTFTTVFDATQQGHSTWWFPAIWLAIAVIGTFFVLGPTIPQRPIRAAAETRVRRAFAGTVLVFGLILGGLGLLAAYRDQENNLSILSSGQYSVVEGLVTNFTTIPHNGHGRESFTVAGQHFSYSPYKMTNAFHQIAADGGPMRDGLYVRIIYRDDVILKIEIGQ